MGENLVSTKEKDYLDEDKPIRGQNYCLVSFLSPEDILKEKEVYYFMINFFSFAKIVPFNHKLIIVVLWMMIIIRIEDKSFITKECKRSRIRFNLNFIFILN